MSVHPLNARLLGLLEKDAVKGTGDAYDLDGYQLHTHPDLCDHLQALNRPCYRGAFGVPVLANEQSVIFAVALGTSLLAFRLPEPERSEAGAAGGKGFREAGDDWISVPPWSIGKDLLATWCRAAHAYANRIGKGKTP